MKKHRPTDLAERLWGGAALLGWKGMLLALDAVTTKEGINGGLLATEALIELLGITAVTLTQYLTAEALSCSRREDPFFLEGSEGIGIQHFGPLVAIVASCIAT